MRKPKLLLVTPSFQTFILQDINFLSKKYDLIIDSYNWKRKELAPIFMVIQFFNLLVNIGHVNLILVHFGGYWSFFPSLLGKLFQKPVYIILHGTDCASIPELNYGSLRIPLLKWFCGKSYEWATGLFPVSESLVNSGNDFFSKGNIINNGFLYHFPELRKDYSIIHNGFDPEYWNADEIIEKSPRSFLAVLSSEQYMLKGGDLILELAKRFPDCNFKIAGMSKPETLNGNMKNVKFLGKINAEMIRNEYRVASFYFQLSVFEGFGCALCEAMLCGCTPIGSKANIIPEIIGETGYVLDHRDINLLEKLIRKILETPVQDTFNRKARERIKQKYSLQSRQDLLFTKLPY
ncbi:glycosyltransferase family 4 protein [Aquiflexum sp.]|uniref:glycosyltransferase family 4 protein n=1 Tax=Aquiflexum sp. TaxID=1872584 RepID=UPI0035946317